VECSAAVPQVLRSRTTEKATAFRPWNRSSQKLSALAAAAGTHADRFAALLMQVADKRLTYAELTGKVGETTV
jgi:hypothetical protein